MNDGVNTTSNKSSIAKLKLGSPIDLLVSETYTPASNLAPPLFLLINAREAAIMTTMEAIDAAIDGDDMEVNSPKVGGLPGCRSSSTTNSKVRASEVASIADLPASCSNAEVLDVASK